MGGGRAAVDGAASEVETKTTSGEEARGGAGLLPVKTMSSSESISGGSG